MLWKVFPDHGRNTPLAQECSNQLTPLQLVLSLPPSSPAWPVNPPVLLH